jgi:hypothetical protein
MRHKIGILAVTLGVLALGPSVVPGAMSLIGLLISLFSLVLSILSINSIKQGYFRVCLFLTLFGILVANDTLRIWGSLPIVSTEFKLIIYGIAIMVLTGCILLAKNMAKDNE